MDLLIEPIRVRTADAAALGPFPRFDESRPHLHEQWELGALIIDRAHGVNYAVTAEDRSGPVLTSMWIRGHGGSDLIGATRLPEKLLASLALGFLDRLAEWTPPRELRALIETGVYSYATLIGLDEVDAKSTYFRPSVAEIAKQVGIARAAGTSSRQHLATIYGVTPRTADAWTDAAVRAGALPAARPGRPRKVEKAPGANISNEQRRDSRSGRVRTNEKKADS